METIMQLVALAKAHAWETLGLYLLLGLLTAAISRRSQIDAWAEAQPRLAGVLKLMRAVNLDYWMILQGLSLLIRGRLPKPKDDSKKPPSGGAGGLVGLALCLPLIACQPLKDVVWPTVTKCAPAPADVMADVFTALKNDTGGPLSVRALKILEDLARKHGAAAIVCAANDVADRLSANGDAESARVSNKARAFLEHVETKVEE